MSSTEGFHTAPPKLLRPVKMVVWDLDDTFWTGTLSEGVVALHESRVAIIRSLNRRGIINSICSKNDAEAVRRTLENHGVWEEFVFPSIDWSAKGQRVAWIVENAQLRAENVLFIDDLELNRQEVRHVLPTIQTAGPEVIDALLTDPNLSGKDDRNLTRLHQYKVMEQKLLDRESTVTSNEEFLRSCKIAVATWTDVLQQSDRLLELVLRTNQLNFTKRRPDRDAFQSQLEDPAFRSGYVSVTDRYGDYGICGFYSISRADNRLQDFCFSCRTMGMGIEQWLYAYLGRPDLEIIGEVASSLDGDVDWITHEVGATPSQHFPSDRATGCASPVHTQRVLMMGGCDLRTTAEFLKGKIETDFSRVAANGALVHPEHTVILRQAEHGLSREQSAVVERYPLLDDLAFSSPAVWNSEYDIFVYSALMDYTQGRYEHRATGLILPWNDMARDATDPTNWDTFERISGHVGVDRPFLEWFSQEFRALGWLSPCDFQDDMAWLADALPPSARLIVINGAEVPVQRPNEPDRHLRHMEMNTALDEVASRVANLTVCDVRPIVTSPEDVGNNLRHYQRRCYIQMAEEIRRISGSTVEVKRKPLDPIFTWLHKNVGPYHARIRRLRSR